jgi:hypothetical protein
MIYVFDSSSFIVLSHYFPERFPSFWKRFDELVSKQRIISVREAYKELDVGVSKPHLRDWITVNKQIFVPPTAEETEFVREIFSVPHYQQLVKPKQRLTSNPVADPFVIAAAKMRNCCVVTEEAKKDNAARIPNVCEHFGVSFLGLEGMMEHENWEF